MRYKANAVLYVCSQIRTQTRCRWSKFLVLMNYYSSEIALASAYFRQDSPVQFHVCLLGDLNIWRKQVVLDRCWHLKDMIWSWARTTRLHIRYNRTHTYKCTNIQTTYITIRTKTHTMFLLLFSNFHPQKVIQFQ